MKRTFPRTEDRPGHKYSMSRYTLWSVIKIPIFLCFKRATIVWISCTAIGSTPAKGSSNIMNFGSIARQRAISARRRSPPESWSPKFYEPYSNRTLKSSFPVSLVLNATSRHLQDRADIIFHRHFPENRSLLRQIANAVASPLIDREFRNLHVIQEDLTLVRSDQTYCHIKGGRLSRSVRTKQNQRSPPCFTLIDT